MHSKRMHEFASDVIVNAAQLAYVEEAHGTNMLLLQLNEFYRYYIRESKMATLYKEIDILNKYIIIQKMRVGDRFSLDVENNIIYQSIYVPRMSLIEFVDKLLTERIEQGVYVWFKIVVQLGSVNMAHLHQKTDKGEYEYRFRLDIEPPGKEDGNV